MQFAAEAYGWSYDEIMWRTPASAIAVLRRQNLFVNGDNSAFPLSSIEALDNG